MSLRISNNLISSYENSIDSYGIRETWLAYIAKLMSYLRPDLHISDAPTMRDDIDTSIIDALSDTILDDIDELYEYGLAYADKNSKKKLGQYYTPTDTARFMSRILLDDAKRLGISPWERTSDSMATDRYSISRIVEPCCGTGRLITALLLEMANRGIDVWDVTSNHLMLCDVDCTAIDIAKACIIARFAPKDLHISFDDIASKVGDFLLDDIVIDDDDMVIQNPPYGSCDGKKYDAYATSHLNELYMLFLEKCATAGVMCAITPYSFVGAVRFSQMRSALDKSCGGTIWSYDIVPAGMFCGREHGIFNTNSANSVRASISLTSSHNCGSGFVIAPMLRWHSDERCDVFDVSLNVVEPYADDVAEHTKGHNPWAKLPMTLRSVHDHLCHDNVARIGDVAEFADDNVSNSETLLYVPLSLRYYTSAASSRLNRSSMAVLSFADDVERCLTYLVLNSSLGYMWWRIYDGGISLTKALLMSISVPHDGIDIEKAIKAAHDLMNCESEYINVKMNAGKQNESVKFPMEIADANTRILLPKLTDEEYAAIHVLHSSYLSEQRKAWKTTK